MAQTNIPDFIGELDAGIFESKLGVALSEVALGVLTNDKAGEVTVKFSLKRMDSDNPQVQIQHKLSQLNEANLQKKTQLQRQCMYTKAVC